MVADYDPGHRVLRHRTGNRAAEMAPFHHLEGVFWTSILRSRHVDRRAVGCSPGFGIPLPTTNRICRDGLPGRDRLLSLRIPDASPVT
jgi:hypothetical protein